jgi:Ni,Fe-hydrogenase III small subunit/ferredoxin
MLNIVRERLKQGFRTVPFPAGNPPVLPDRYQGLPVLDEARCPDGCRACADACPTDAITAGAEPLTLDLGRCIFCSECTAVCDTGAIRFTADFHIAARKREDLVVSSNRPYPALEPLKPSLLKIFQRSLKLRQVSAGGDNSSEADLNVLGTIVFDLGRFGIQFVASPRHADAVVVTGPVPANMKLGLLKTYEAMPAPKLVIAVGADAISGGIFRGHPEAHDGVEGLLPVDLYIPGNPPHPLTILDGLLRLLDRIP